MTEHQEGFEVSKEIARKAEVVMLYENCDFMCALSVILRKHPDLLKRYVQDIQRIRST